MKATTRSIAALKGERPIVALTAYDAPTAHYIEETGAVDLILVGDSVGTTQLGFESTVPVTLEMMVHHTAAVARARRRALLVADLPFPWSGADFPDLLDAARRLMQDGCADGVKLEGGAAIAPAVGRLTGCGIPVLGHIGLLPQSVNRIGGYRQYGRTAPEKESLLRDALELQQAGCFAVVAEMVEGTLAGSIAAELAIPLIGIGSGPHCDGQILVINDLAGLTPGPVPSFARRYADLGDTLQAAVAAFAAEVVERKFPQ